MDFVTVKAVNVCNGPYNCVLCEAMIPEILLDMHNVIHFTVKRRQAKTAKTTFTGKKYHEDCSSSLLNDVNPMKTFSAKVTVQQTGFTPKGKCPQNNGFFVDVFL